MPPCYQNSILFILFHWPEYFGLYVKYSFESMSKDAASGAKDCSTFLDHGSKTAWRRIDPYDLSSGDNPGSIIS